ncbi:MAG: hypothetical protein ABL891_06570 [Burkholderiales bacterium]
MKQDMPLQFSYAALFDPAVTLAAARRAEQWDLPRHICHPLDRYVGRRVGPDLSAYDAAVDLAPASEDETPDDRPCATCGFADTPDADFEDADDL